MKKKIHPKDQTKKLSEARYEFLKRNPEKMRDTEDAFKDFRASRKNHKELEEEIERDIIERAIRKGMCLPAAWQAGFIWSYMRLIINKKPKPGTGYNERITMWREQILEEAKLILDQMILPHPGETLLISIDLKRSKKVILAEVERLFHEARKDYQSGWIHKGGGPVKESRLKWLPIADELLEVWDLWDKAGQTPWQKSFRTISRKVGRPLSTVKTQWRLAYEKIYGKPYEPESKYENGAKFEEATELCAKCPHIAGKRLPCYKSGEWLPCSEYIKLMGKQPSIRTVEFHDELQYDGSYRQAKTSDDND